MKLQEVINLAEGRDLKKSYIKSDGLYIWDYKALMNEATQEVELHLIPSDSGKAGFKDKVSVDELVNYVLDEYDPQVPADDIISQMKIIGVEGITIARI